MIWRISARDRPAARGGFVNMPATSATIATLSPRAANGASGQAGKPPETTAKDKDDTTLPHDPDEGGARGAS